jgi:signal transduction histidine kinase
MKQKDILLTTDLPPSLNVFADSLRTSQIIINLINNAYKFTDKGFIRVRGFITEESEQDCILNVEVTDSGIGISSTDQDLLFKPFHQIGIQQTGSGLGLSICHKLVNSMKGEINVRSELGKGSTFEFKIPLRKVTEENII